MNDRQALLIPIAANPLDEIPKAIYADWLLQHDSEETRARERFIRLSVECEALEAERRVGLFPSVHEMRAELTALSAQWHDAWLQAETTLDRVKLPSRRQCDYRAGFISQVHLPLYHWMDPRVVGGNPFGVELIRTVPIEQAILTDMEPWRAWRVERYVWYEGRVEDLYGAGTPLPSRTRAILPADIFACLSQATGTLDTLTGQMLYKQLPEAVRDAARAAASWARSWAAVKR